MMHGNGSSGQLSVPPGFRFHPTDEELLYYYLKKKVCYEAIDLDVIREVDLNKLEPWDLKDRCRIGSGPQNEWYFFSHKDKKYPTGTRTNRATAAGFWKATGRDKAIFLGNSKRIGMRKTLVFYTGRAPHGHKTDWIMHEYRLNDEDPLFQQEDGWVVCRVFKKKNPGRGSQDDEYDDNIIKQRTNSTTQLQPPKQQSLVFPNNYLNNYTTTATTTTTFDATMHLPQLSSLDSSISANNGATLFTTMDNLLRLSAGTDHRLSNVGEWGFLDKLLANYQQHQQEDSQLNKIVASAAINHDILGIGSSSANAFPHHQLNNKFPFQYLGSESDLFKFSK